MDESQLIDQLFDCAQSAKISSIREFARLNLPTYNLASIRNSHDQTLLHVAAGFGRTNLVSYLIGKGADVNALDKSGQTPLHNACCHGHLTVSRKLIDAGALVDLTDNQGWSPLHFALSRKDSSMQISPAYWRVVELLLSSEANPYLKSQSGKSCFDRVKSKDDRFTLRLTHMLHKLKNCGDDKKLRETIIDKEFRVDDYFHLLEKGDDLFQEVQLLTTPRLINARFIDKKLNHITALHRAAAYNQLEVAKFLISEGARVDATDNRGQIPLHNAAEFGHIDMIDILVEAGSDINMKDLNGYTPLHVATADQTFHTCLKLVNLGAIIESRCNQGYLPYDLVKTDDVMREVLRPVTMRSRLIPSTSNDAIYIVQEDIIQKTTHDPTPKDSLMLDSNSNERLFNSLSHSIKKIILDQNEREYQLIKERMLGTIMKHNSESSGIYTTYDIISIERILNEKVWSKYKLKCQSLEIDYGKGSKNEKLLFHGSRFIDNIESHGFDVRYAQLNGMFGAGIYFAEHSSKSNQYVFGFGNGCQAHMDKSCFICERKMVFAQVALGRSLISREALSQSPHAPPGYDSVTGLPTPDNLIYPEYVIYSGDQAYPLYVIRYRLK